MNDGIQDVIWRLTVRDPQGKIVYGPRVHLADKTMIAAVKRWDGKDVSLLREYAIRGAWQNVDTKPCLPIPYDEPTSSLNDRNSWVAPSEIIWSQPTWEEMTQGVSGYPADPKPLTQAEWERRVTDMFGPSPRDQAAQAEIDSWNTMTPEECSAYMKAHRSVPKTRS